MLSFLSLGLRHCSPWHPRRKADDMIICTLNDLTSGNAKPSTTDCGKVYSRLQQIYDLRRVGKP